MGTFDDNRASLDLSYTTGMDRIAEELDGRAPAPKPAPAVAVSSPVQAASAPTPPTADGPGFFSRLWSGIGSAASKAADLAEDVASRAEIRSVSGARANAAAQLPPPQPETPYAMILGAIAAGIVVLALLFRRS